MNIFGSIGILKKNVVFNFSLTKQLEREMVVASPF